MGSRRDRTPSYSYVQIFIFFALMRNRSSIITFSLWCGQHMPRMEGNNPPCMDSDPMLRSATNLMASIQSFRLKETSSLIVQPLESDKVPKSCRFHQS